MASATNPRRIPDRYWRVNPARLVHFLGQMVWWRVRI